MGGWDHHSKLHYFQDYKFIELNDALSSFVDELKLQKKWDDTTIVVSSDFGRYVYVNDIILCLDKSMPNVSLSPERIYPTI
jgi:uncharacterized protein (DUF1501 family)